MTVVTASTLPFQSVFISQNLEDLRILPDVHKTLFVDISGFFLEHHAWIDCAVVQDTAITCSRSTATADELCQHFVLGHGFLYLAYSPCEIYVGYYCLWCRA